MKKTYLVVILLLVCFWPNHSFGTMENRLQWWELRLERMIAEKERIRENKEQAPQLLNLFDHEIARTKKLISIYESGLSGVNPSTHERRVVTDADVKSEIQRLVPPLFAVRFLEILVNEAGSAGSVSAARVLVAQGVEDLFRAITGHDGDELAMKSIKEEIRQNDWKVISREIFFDRMMTSHKRLRAQVEEGVEGLVKKKLLPRHNAVTEMELRTLVISAFIEFVKDFDLLGNLPQSCEALEGSWSWRRIRPVLEKKFEEYRESPIGAKRARTKTATGENYQEDRSVRGFAVLYRYQVAREREYLAFLVKLVAEGAQMPPVDAAGMHQAFGLAVSRLSSFFKATENSLSIEKKYQITLSRKEIAAVKELRTGFIGDVNSLRSDIRNYCRDRAKQKLASESQIRKRHASYKNTIAQHEVESLLEYAKECAGRYDELNYAERIFARYALQFESLMKEAKAGIASPFFESAVAADTLFKTVDGFDHNRMIVEFSAKKFLRDEIKSTLSCLVTLFKHYKKKGIDIQDFPSRQELAALEAPANRFAEVKIDSWIMNESNFSDVDKKAAHRLSLLLDKKTRGTAMQSGGKKKAGDGSLSTMTVSGPGILLTLPRGWEEVPLGETERYLGIVRSFRSGDTYSSIQLVKVKVENGDAKEASEQWIRKSGCTLIEKRWGKVNELEYLWILARDRERNIVEACAVVRDGYALLISGSAAREKSATFSVQFQSIINSLQAGKI